MHIMHARCAGLDVHKKTVVACVLTPDGQGGWGQEMRTFGTMTVDVLALADWLLACGCTHVAIESTGDYWKPVFNILEGSCEVLLVNAQHIKAVPGRKADVKDAAWLAELLQHGLLRASFIPPVAQRELRDLTRYRSDVSANRLYGFERFNLQSVQSDSCERPAKATFSYVMSPSAINGPIGFPGEVAAPASGVISHRGLARRRGRPRPRRWRSRARRVRAEIVVTARGTARYGPLRPARPG
jgi:hypothetical protein